MANNRLQISGLHGDLNFSYNVVETPLDIPLVSEPVTISDVTFQYDASATQINNFRVDIVAGVLSTSFIYTVLPDSFGDVTVDLLGNVTLTLDALDNPIQQGSVSIGVESDLSGSKRYESQALAESPPKITSALPLSFGVGTLAEHIKAAVDAMVLGKTATDPTYQTYWSVNNADVNAPVATLNPTRFMSSVDLSAMCAMREDEAIKGFPDRYPVELISDRHAIMAHHTIFSIVGSKIVFQRNDGTFQITSVLSVSAEIPDSDIAIVYLADAITGITPFKILPIDWSPTYAPSLLVLPSTYGDPVSSIPSISKRMHNNLNADASWINVSDVLYKNPDTAVIGLIGDLMISEPAWSNLSPWWDDITAGDSGSPGFFVINGEPVLLNTLETFSLQTDYSNHVSEINTIMNDLASVPQGTYAIQHIDLTGFTTF